MEKPAIISEDAVIDWCEKRRGGPYVVIGSRDQREAQRDDTYQKMLDAFQEQIKKSLLTDEEIVISVCGDCPFEDTLDDEGCRQCKRQLHSAAQAQLDKVLKEMK